MAMVNKYLMLKRGTVSKVYNFKSQVASEDPEINWRVIQDFVVTLWVLGLAEDEDTQGVDVNIMDCRPEAKYL